MEAGRPRVPGSLSALHSKLAGGEWIDAHDNLILCGPMPTPAECAGTAIFIPVTNPLERSKGSLYLVVIMSHVRGPPHPTGYGTCLAW